MSEYFDLESFEKRQFDLRGAKIDPEFFKFKTRVNRGKRKLFLRKQKRACDRVVRNAEMEVKL